MERTTEQMERKLNGLYHNIHEGNHHPDDLKKLHRQVNTCKTELSDLYGLMIDRTRYREAQMRVERYACDVAK